MRATGGGPACRPPPGVCHSRRPLRPSRPGAPAVAARPTPARGSAPSGCRSRTDGGGFLSRMDGREKNKSHRRRGNNANDATKLSASDCRPRRGVRRSGGGGGGTAAAAPSRTPHDGRPCGRVGGRPLHRRMRAAPAPTRPRAHRGTTTAITTTHHRTRMRTATTSATMRGIPHGAVAAHPTPLHLPRSVATASRASCRWQGGAATATRPDRCPGSLTLDRK